MTTPVDIARCAPCPHCRAAVGESCAAAMLRAAQQDPGVDGQVLVELQLLADHAPHLAHEERHKAAEELVDSAVAYGLVRRIPAANGR